MANVQKQFTDFHDAIKLDDENETLREKRERILKKLKEKINADAPSFTSFVQGSYAMSTGVKPLSGEFDIDVGLSFDMSKDDHDPVPAKQWVLDALAGHTSSVVMKTPCVTATYFENGEASFHVDLAVYAAGNSDGNTYLAKGKPNSNPEKKIWESSDPKELIRLVKNQFSEADDRAQFRRIIRYLKRWKDKHFPTTGHAAPTGIALTVAAMKYLQPNYSVDTFTGKRSYNDLVALKNFTKGLLDAFITVINEYGTHAERLIIYVPTPNYNDLFDKMTDSQMDTFKTKLTALWDALVKAKDEVDPVEACKTLQKQFGDDFPVPPKEDTAQKKMVAVATGSASGGA